MSTRADLVRSFPADEKRVCSICGGDWTGERLYGDHNVEGQPPTHLYICRPCATSVLPHLLKDAIYANFTWAEDLRAFTDEFHRALENHVRLIDGMLRRRQP